MTPVKFEKVVKSFPGKVVLDEIDLEIPENNITVIIGKSGSGKSTILKLINGLIKPDGGEIKVFGEKINYKNLISLRKQIGYSVQGISLFPHLNIYENISLLARVTGKNKIETDERVNFLMKLVGLPLEYLKKYPFEISGGEQQRVGICRAMMLNPKIFLLDEAFGALDPLTKNEIHEKLLEIQKTEPRTIIMVTHDLAEAFHLADIIILIDNGKIQQQGIPQEIKANPSNNFVSRYIQSQLI